MGTDVGWRSWLALKLGIVIPLRMDPFAMMRNALLADDYPQLAEWPLATEQAGYPVPWRQARNRVRHRSLDRTGDEEDEFDLPA